VVAVVVNTFSTKGRSKMTVADVFFGKSEERREAEQRLRYLEDHMMDLDPMEETSLPLHAKADANRVQILLTRMRVVQTTNEQNANRNFLATILCFLAILAVLKGGSILEVMKLIL
jgi:hypothetical protein